jgi:hypothetical protein
MLWIGLLAGHLNCSLAATSGVEGPEQVIKYLLVGADTVMTASALLRHGPSYIQSMVTQLAAWLEEHGYPSVAAIRGLKSVKQLDDVSELLRAQYMHLLTEYVPRQFAARELVQRACELRCCHSTQGRRDLAECSRGKYSVVPNVRALSSFECSLNRKGLTWRATGSSAARSLLRKSFNS